MQRLIDTAQGFSRILVWIGGAMILLSALLVTVEVFIRKFLNTSIARR